MIGLCGVVGSRGWCVNGVMVLLGGQAKKGRLGVLYVYGLEGVNFKL